MWFRQEVQALPRAAVLTTRVHALRVVAGLLEQDGRFLVSQRPSGGHGAGLWEFPGGKCEPGESDAETLARELREELGIAVHESTPFSEVTHQYPERLITVAFRWVVRWEGAPYGAEGQKVAWMARATLEPDTFLPANAGVVSALKAKVTA